MRPAPLSSEISPLHFAAVEMTAGKISSWHPVSRNKEPATSNQSLVSTFYLLSSIFYLLSSIVFRLFKALKKRFPLKENVFLLFFNSLADDLFAFVVTAYRAYMMRFFQCMALRAFHKTRNSQLPVSTSLITTGSGTFCLRNRHS